MEYMDTRVFAIHNGSSIMNAMKKYEGTLLKQYSQDIHTTLIDNITGKHDVEYCMFKAQLYLHDDLYSCERIYKHGLHGLYFQKNNEPHREHGFDIQGQDPRIFIVQDKVYVMFICLSPYPHQYISIGITSFDEWNPVFLQVEKMTKNYIEKNWAPFVKDNQLYFVYNYDPLIILHYDFNVEGKCKVVFKQGNVPLPIDTSNTYLRGGSNLIHYKEDYYIGGCHSRIFTTCFEHYTHIILLNTRTWELVYVSPPIKYTCHLKENFNSWWVQHNPSLKPIDTWDDIIIDRTPHIIQDPVSLYTHRGKHFITINVRDTITLLYEIVFPDLLKSITANKPIGYYDMYTNMSLR